MKPKKAEAKKSRLVNLLKTVSGMKKSKTRKDECQSTLSKSSRTPRKQKHDDFKTFLSARSNLIKFREFLKMQYCTENLDFYLACEKFRQLDRDKVGKELIKFMANQIYNDFLGDKARQPVNIDYECLQNILWQLKNPSQDLFFDAQTEIFNLMESDCYPRYQKSKRITDCSGNSSKNINCSNRNG